MNLPSTARGAEYYVSPRGADSNVGTSPQSAWQTLSRLQKQPLLRGDRVWLEGGATFRGSLLIEANDADNDAATNPKHLEIGSFGTARAIIEAGNESAVVIRDRGGLVVRDLILRGDGLGKNTGAGLRIENTRPKADKRAFVRVSGIEASGFHRAGISVSSNPPDASQSGFSDVRIEKCDTHDNVHGGILVTGVDDAKATTYSHQNVEIVSCRAWNNSGDPTYLKNHSGSGLFIGNTNGGRISHSEAWNNGALCNHPNGGPVGIWTYASRAIKIDRNVSHGNRTGKSLDGGGFDFDGGVSDSVMEYNLSYDNDGAGFLVFNYPDSPYEFKNNVVRFNTSFNDGRKAAYGAVYVGNYGKSLENIRIENNSFITSAQEGAAPAVIRVRNTKDVVFRDNLFLSRGVPLLIAEHQNSGLRFDNNVWSADGPAIWNWYGTKLESLKAFEDASRGK